MSTVKKVSGVTAVVVALFTGGVYVLEGLPTNSDGNHPVYLDSAGIKTACYGETKNLVKKEYTTEECNAMLSASTKHYSTALSGLPPLPVSTYVGALDFTYNAGKGAFLGSGIRRCLLAGETVCASREVLKWRYISKPKVTQKEKALGWTWNASKKKYTFDCSLTYNGKRNTVCWGLWERRQWQSKLLKGDMSEAEVQLAFKQMSK